MTLIRWGILSTANIGVQKVIPAMQKAQNSTVQAIASSSEAKATNVARALSIPTAYSNYDALLQDPNIDAIYNPLPNHMHVEWTLKCLAAGKHVLCEKPLSNNIDHIQQLIAAQNQTGLIVGEAFMIKAAPQWQKVMQLINSGELGEIHAVQGSFFYKNTDANNIRNQADALGGAMMDIGCYPLMVARMVFNSEPNRVIASMNLDPVFKTDRLTSALLEFNNGQCTFTVGTQTSPFQRVLILGSKKHLEVLIPFNSPNDQKTCIRLHGGNILNEYESVFEFDTCDQYTLQTENFNQATTNATEPLTPLTDSLHHAAALQAIFHSAQTSQWQTPST